MTHLIPTEDMLKIGFCLERDHPDLCRSFYLASESTYWNRPTITIYNDKEEKDEHYTIIYKFTGQNDWYGKMEPVFRGYLKSVRDLKVVLKLLRLNDYKKFKK